MYLFVFNNTIIIDFTFKIIIFYLVGFCLKNCFLYYIIIVRQVYHKMCSDILKKNILFLKEYKKCTSSLSMYTLNYNKIVK